MNNKVYKLGKNTKDIIWNIYVNNICEWFIFHPAVRRYMLRAGGVRIGDHTRILARNFFGSKTVTIGSSCFINFNCFIEGHTHIGNNCNIAYKVTFCTSSHQISSHKRRAGKNTTEDIYVGDGTWIGADSIILPGIHIGSGCIIGAGSVVTKDCEDDCLYAGNLAKLIKKLR